MIVIDSLDKLRMKPEQASKWLGLGVETIRLRLQKGIVSWGDAVYTGKYWSYNIYTAKLFDTLGIPYKVDIKEKTL